MPSPRPSLLAAALLAAACGPSPSPSAPSAPARAPAPAAAAQGEAPLPAQRFAEATLAPAAFPDPARRDKLAAAFPEVERYLAAEIQKMQLPGVAVGIVIDGDLAYSRGFGVRDVEAGAAPDAETAFRIASMTKSFTAMAILKLRDEGRLRLDDPAVRYVPELSGIAYPTRDAAPITVRDLLSHGAGFPEDNPWGDRQLAMSEDDFSALLRKGVPFSTSPATQFEYSNLGFAILGRIVNRVSGVPYRDFLYTEILRPLGMTGTVLDAREVPAARLARGHHREEKGGLTRLVDLPDGAFGPMGGLYSSVRDMARYAAYHLSAWPPRDAPEAGPLRRSSLREMQQSARDVGLFAWPGGVGDRPPGARAVGYAFGLGTAEACDIDRVVSHSGGLPGWGSILYMLPDHGVAVIALANVTYASAGRLAQGVVRILAKSGGLVARAPVPAPALVEAQGAVGRLLAGWDDAAADAALADSLFLDVPRARQRERFEALRAAHGACRPEGPIEAENALRGTWKLACERGWIDVSLTLAPTLPSRAQFLAMEGSFPPGARLAEAAAQVAALTARWDEGAAGRLFDAKLDRADARRRVEAVGAARGPCRVDRPVGGDGARRARVQLACERQPVVLDVSIDERSGKVTALDFAPPRGRAGKCAQ